MFGDQRNVTGTIPLSLSILEAAEQKDIVLAGKAFPL